MLYLVGCLCYLYQWCTVKQISKKDINFRWKQLLWSEKELANLFSLNHQKKRDQLEDTGIDGIKVLKRILNKNDKGVDELHLPQDMWRVCCKYSYCIGSSGPIKCKGIPWLAENLLWISSRDILGWEHLLALKQWSYVPWIFCTYTAWFERLKHDFKYEINRPTYQIIRKYL